MTDLKPGIAQLAQALAASAPVETLRSLPLPERDAVLIFGEWRALPDTVRHGFSIGGQSAVLDIPRATLDWILGPLGVSCPDDPMQRGMLLELACLDLLTAIEAALGASAEPDAAEVPATAFDVAIGPHRLSLHLSPPLAQALGDVLDRHAVAPDPPDLGALSLPVTLRLGQQYLAPGEVADLAPGDVIMLEPGPAMLLAGGLGAAVDLGADGPRIRSDLLPLPVPSQPGPLVTFDAARTEMTLEALNALGPDDLMPLAHFAAAACDMVIDGRIAGRGVPVTIGAADGIRILHLFNATDR
ncbi:FliM/FliN family flagellar motor switch protein [Cereibacter sp. SYSU M97828]|nr:FliM/FliN family flagellar motor switch protein [Cereibacter flavus]